MTSNKNDDGPTKAFDRMSMSITSNEYRVSRNNWKMVTITMGVTRMGVRGDEKIVHAWRFERD